MRRLICKLCTLVGGWIGAGPDVGMAYTANKVWFEFLATGRYRVNVVYTVPELKELRESHVEFVKKSEAEALYWDLVKGADFFPPQATERRFSQQPLSPEPW
ncbi:MAG: hypothetical protein FJ146_10235 [Deltaproteobacteria bacterium]|nr:hypothetical protein [Deltaproteobacteria bacterium]